MSDAYLVTFRKPENKQTTWILRDNPASRDSGYYVRLRQTGQPVSTHTTCTLRGHTLPLEQVQQVSLSKEDVINSTPLVYNEKIVCLETESGIRINDRLSA